MKESNNMYVTFDPESGKILGCSVQKSLNAIAIDVALGEKFIMGIESMSNYIVQYSEGVYKFRKHGVVDKANSLTKAERAATSKKKVASDKQFVANTKKAKVQKK